MRTPGMFGISKELSPEERFAEMERKYSVIVERIQSYDKLLSDHASLVQKHADLTEEVQTLKDSQTQLEGSFSNHKIVASRSHDGINRSISALGSRIDNAESLISDVNRSQESGLSDLKNAIDEVDQIHVVAREGLVRRESLFSLTSNISNSIESILMNLSHFQNDLKVQSNKHDELCSSHSNHGTRISDVEANLNSTRQDLAHHKKDASYVEATLRSQMEKSANQLKEQVINYMDQTKIEMIGAPSSLESVQKAIANRLDSITLDGSNAVMKSANNEQQIKLLEKKLENLSILVKKNEFSKMG